MRSNLTFKEKLKKCKCGMKYHKISSLTLNRHLCHTTARETALMQRKDPFMFCWLEREGKNKSREFAKLLCLDQSRKDQSLPSKGVDFPTYYDMTCTGNHWSNKSKASQHLEKIVFLCVEEKKKTLNLPLDRKAMLIFDVFKRHFTEITSTIEENNCVIIYVANNLTDQFSATRLQHDWSSKAFFKKEVRMLVRPTNFSSIGKLNKCL